MAMYFCFPVRTVSCIAAVFLAFLCCTGCGTMPNGRGWGHDASIAPGWDRVGRAAWNAVVAPETWAPAVGAVAFHEIGHADQKVSDWASRTTPVFGSPDRADRMSDDLATASEALWLASVVAAPSGNEFDEWFLNKLKGAGVQGGTAMLLYATVGGLKDAVDRTRPNGEPGSMPSGHASGTALFATMTSKNLEAFGWSDDAVMLSRIGLGTLTAATSWARVEAQKHYPSDVLAGMALGHFFGAFFTDAFLGIDDPNAVLVLLEPSRSGAVATVRFGF